MDSPGWTTLIPALVVIVTAIFSCHPIESLLAGVFAIAVPIVMPLAGALTLLAVLYDTSDQAVP